MIGETSVYDLGEVDYLAQSVSRSRPTVSHPSGAARYAPERSGAAANPAASAAAPTPGALREFSGSLSVLLPGSGQALAGELRVGLFFMSSLGFLFALSWALLETLDRLTGTLEILSLPAAAGVWALVGIFVAAAALHLGSVLRATESAAGWTVHPVLAGLASALLPGWGQVLNGNRIRAAAFLLSLWLAGAAWVLSSPATERLLSSLDLSVPAKVQWICTPQLLWILPAVTWALAVYDAAVTASNGN